MVPESAIVPPASKSRHGSVFIVGVDSEAEAGLSWPAVAAIEAADAVLFDDALDPIALAAIPRACFREAVSSQAGAEPGEVARIRQLSADGWRIVRLVRSGAGQAGFAATVRRLAEAGVAVRALSAITGAQAHAVAARDLPHPAVFGGAMNGLAG